jgi:hypothetical protein
MTKRSLAVKHEAAHIAVLLALGGKVKRAWVHPDGAGKTVEEAPLAPTNQAKYLAAGVVAENSGRPIPPVVFPAACREDEAKLRRLHQRLAPNQSFGVFWRAAYRDAYAILRRNGPTLRAAKRMLTARQEVTAADVQRYIAGVTAAVRGVFSWFRGEWRCNGKPCKPAVVPKAARERWEARRKMWGRNSRQRHLTSNAGLSVGPVI